MSPTSRIVLLFVMVGAIASYLPHPALGPPLPQALADYWQDTQSPPP